MATETYAALRAFRAFRKLSQQQTAKEAGISRYRLQQAEAGYVDLTKTEFEAVANVLRLDDDDVWTKAFWEDAVPSEGTVVADHVDG
jgi:transcriptional regulator with XRE-family HTH domain